MLTDSIYPLQLSTENGLVTTSSLKAILLFLIHYQENSLKNNLKNYQKFYQKFYQSFHHKNFYQNYYQKIYSKYNHHKQSSTYNCEQFNYQQNRNQKYNQINYQINYQPTYQTKMNCNVSPGHLSNRTNVFNFRAFIRCLLLFLFLILSNHKVNGQSPANNETPFGKFNLYLFIIKLIELTPLINKFRSKINKL